MHLNIQDSFESMLKSFYNSVSINHPQFEHKKQVLDLLMKKLKNRSIIQSEKDDLQNRFSKATQSTLSDQASDLSCHSSDLQEPNFLDFTFYPRQPTTNVETTKQTINHKFRSNSQTQVLLYGLLFSHLYVLNQSSQLPEILAANSHIFQLIRNAINTLIHKSKIGRYSSYSGKIGQLMALFENIDKKTFEKRNEALKNIIESFDFGFIQAIFVVIAQSQGLYNSKSLSAKFLKRQKEEDDCNNGADGTLIFQKVVEALKIRIKLQERNRQCSFGSKKSLVCIVIRKSTRSQEFSLSELICYAGKSQKKHQRSSENLKTSNTFDYSQI